MSWRKGEKEYIKPSVFRKQEKTKTKPNSTGGKNSKHLFINKKKNEQKKTENKKKSGKQMKETKKNKKKQKKTKKNEKKQKKQKGNQPSIFFETTISRN